jgi:hypothetical protein
MRVRHQETDDEEDPVSTTNYGVLGPLDAQRLQSVEDEKRHLNRRVQWDQSWASAPGSALICVAALSPPGQGGNVNEQAAAGRGCQLRA